MEQPIFEIHLLPGKGRSIISTSDIAKGTRVLCEKPLMIIDSMLPSMLEKTLATKLRSLPKDKQRDFLSLHNNFPGKHPFSGIIKTTALPCGSGSSTSGVYPTICLVNHSCAPNAHNNWNEQGGFETIHAVRDIAAGEEITIDYSKGTPSASRRAKLKDDFGFECDCTACSLPPEALKASDARREEIQRLDDAIGDPFRMQSNPGASIADCRSLLRVLDEEYHGAVTANVASIYYDAFQISVAHGDRARASAFAERAYEARVVCEGEDSPLTVRMRGYMQDPATHPSFAAYSTKWRGPKGFSPKSLAAAEFEAWLWRRGN